MKEQEFQIEFTHEGIFYRGLVRPFRKDSEVRYAISVEDAGQEKKVDIVLCPTASLLDEWTYELKDGTRADQCYNNDLLEEIGEQVEACLADSGKAGQEGI